MNESEIDDLWKRLNHSNRQVARTALQEAKGLSLPDLASLLMLREKGQTRPEFAFDQGYSFAYISVILAAGSAIWWGFIFFLVSLAMLWSFWLFQVLKYRPPRRPTEYWYFLYQEFVDRIGREPATPDLIPMLVWIMDSPLDEEYNRYTSRYIDRKMAKRIASTRANNLRVLTALLPQLTPEIAKRIEYGAWWFDKQLNAPYQNVDLMLGCIHALCMMKDRFGFWELEEVDATLTNLCHSGFPSEKLPQQVVEAAEQASKMLKRYQAEQQEIGTLLRPSQPSQDYQTLLRPSKEQADPQNELLRPH